MPNISFQALCAGAMRRRGLTKGAAAVLTPEAEQAAVGAPPAGMPPDAGTPPAGAPPMGGDPMGGAPMPGGAPAPAPGGGQLPPEIMQDQGFIQWLAQQGVMLDQASGQFIDQQSGQPLPPDVVMQAYQEYQAQMGGGGAPASGPVPPEAGAPPAGPEGGAPPELICWPSWPRAAIRRPTRCSYSSCRRLWAFRSIRSRASSSTRSPASPYRRK